MGRSRYQTNSIRRTQAMAGLAQFWDYETDWYDSGMAISVPDPATAQGSQSTWSQIIDAGKQILPAYYAAETQKDIAEINLQRLRAGQPPLPESYLRASAPQVRAGLSPDTQRMVMILGVGLIAVLALPMLMRRR